jgi:hypothetical protein
MKRKFALPKSFQIGIRFTVFTVLIIYLFAMLVIKGNAIKTVQSDLNYLVMVNTSNFEKRSCDSAIEYLKENLETILVVASARGEDGNLAMNSEISEYLEENQILSDRCLLFPDAMGDWTLVKNSISYIKADWYGKEEVVTKEPRIGLITQELDTYQYIQYYKRETSMKIYEVAAKVPIQVLPQLTLKELGQLAALHLEEKI